MDNKTTRALIPSRRQLFETPEVSDFYDFKSLSLLLQLVSNWVDHEGLQDPEFDALTIERTFPNPESDECKYAATLYYRKESDSL